MSAVFGGWGRWVYFASNCTGAFQVWKLPIDGGEPVQVTKLGGFYADESPDGKWTYYVKLRTQSRPAQSRESRGPSSKGSASAKGGFARREDPREQRIVWRTPAAGGGDEKEVVGPLRGFADFAVAEHGIYFHPPEDFAGIPTLQYFSFETGESETILRAEKPLWGSIAISPDRGSLLYSQIDSAGSDLVLKLPVTVAWRAERAVYQLKPKLQRFEYARHTGKHRRHVGWPRRAQAEPENAGLGSGMKQFLQVGFFHGPQRIARSLHTRCNSFRGACSLTANSVSDRFRYLGLAPPGCSWFAACAAEVLVRPLA